MLPPTSGACRKSSPPDAAKARVGVLWLSHNHVGKGEAEPSLTAGGEARFALSDRGRALDRVSVGTRRFARSQDGAARRGGRCRADRAAARQAGTIGVAAVVALTGVGTSHHAKVAAHRWAFVRPRLWRSPVGWVCTELEITAGAWSRRR